MLLSKYDRAAGELEGARPRSKSDYSHQKCPVRTFWRAQRDFSWSV